MERDYIEHLEKALEESNKLLKTAMLNNSCNESTIKRLTKESESHSKLWLDASSANRKLVKEIEGLNEDLAEMKKVLEAQKKEQEAATSNSFNNLKEVI